MRISRLLSFTAVIIISRFIGSPVDNEMITITGIEAEKEAVLALKTKIKIEDFDLDIETGAVTRE